MTDVIRYLIGGLLFNTLCGALMGILLALTLKDRLSPRTATALLGLISAVLISGALWVLFHIHPDRLLRLPAGLLIYPFYNKLTAGTSISQGLALLLDAAWMTFFAQLAWRRIRKRQDAYRFPSHE